MKYEVGLRIDGRYYVTVEASSLQEAKELACVKASDADFGELDCIDWNVIHSTDELGRRHDFT